MTGRPLTAEPEKSADERVVLVVSGLKDIGGHTYPYTRSVELELRARGFSVEVLANRALAPALRDEAEYQPVFSKGSYDFPTGSSHLRLLLDLWSKARTFASELGVALSRVRGAKKLVFCHTLFDSELLGWSRFLRRSSLRAPVILLLRQSPNFANMGFYRRWLHPYSGIKARALWSIDRSIPGRFVLATDTDSLSADYSRIFGGRIATFPIPVDQIAPPEASAPIAPILTFGYLGDCRASKGFHRLAPMIEQVIANDPGQTVRFRVQLYKGSFHEGGSPPGWGDLEVISTRFPGRLELVRGVLNAADYQRLFQSLDGVLIPNDHPAFQSGSSNVFCEAAAYGKPVVVPEGTWMAGQLARFGGGECFCLARAASFGQAVLNLADGWEAARGKAERFSPIWRQQHNPSSLVDALLAASAAPVI